MEAWKENWLSALLEGDTEKDLYTNILGIAKEIGFEYCGYGIQFPVPISKPFSTLFHNYRKEFVERYHERNYGAIDPCIKHALTSSRPFIWSDRCVSATPEMCDDARLHGLRHGWAKPTRDARGALGILTLARSAGRLEKNELQTKSAKMDWLAELAHEGMAGYLLPKHVPEIKARMTLREREVLRWTAEGKTASEIGQILLISENTVVFHLKNVTVKLNASNKIQAAVKATALGILW